MDTVKKQFSIALLKIGKVPFSINTFENIMPKEIKDEKFGEEIQCNKVIEKEIKENRFICIYFEEGNTIPRTDFVYNRTTQSDEENPRSIDQIERDSQTFVLIDIQTQRIFISNFKKKKAIESWIIEKVKEPVFIKDIIDRENFLDEIEGINTIYLSAVPNLFSSMGILGQELTNDYHNYGTRIKHIGVKISFEENNLPEPLKKMAYKIMKQRSGGAIQKLEISGRYDEKFERVFNTEEIIDRIMVETMPLKSGLLDKNQIFNNLIQQIPQ